MIAINAVYKDERGNMTMINVVAVMLCTVLTTFILNTSQIATRRIERQDVADAVAVSSGYWMQRGMNAVTATNHVIGELTGIVIVHHALGGDLLDDGGMAENQSTLVSNTIEKGQDLKQINQRLELAKRAAEALGYRVQVYDLVREESGVKSEAAILDGKVTLKKRLTEVYWTAVAAKILQMFPYTRPAGQALEQAMTVLEQWIGMEYRVLNAATSVAKGLTKTKQLVRDEILVAAKKYTDEVVKNIPAIAEKAAVLIAKENNKAVGTTFPFKLKLPLKIDPHAEATSIVKDPRFPTRVIQEKESCNCDCPSVETAITRDQINKISQLARATFPWVVYHREPVINALKVAPLSKAAHFYKDHSDGYSKRITNALQTTTTSRRVEKIQLYVLEDHFAPDKGFESFTDNPETADKLFAVVGLAYWKKPMVIGQPLFKQFHKEGQIAVAQALIYNANDQVIPDHKIDLTCKRIRPNRQADVGWDTLNWKSGIRPSELVAKWDNGGAPKVIYPEIQVNWQCKLVPVSNSVWNRMIRASDLPSEFQSVLAKLIPHTQGCMNTH
jgi:hypothetical protein